MRCGVTPGVKLTRTSSTVGLVAVKPVGAVGAGGGLPGSARSIGVEFFSLDHALRFWFVEVSTERTAKKYCVPLVNPVTRVDVPVSRPETVV